MSTVAKFERDLLETNERYRSAKSPNFTYVCVVSVCGGAQVRAPPHRRPCIISRLCAAISAKAHFNESP